MKYLWVRVSGIILTPYIQIFSEDIPRNHIYGDAEAHLETSRTSTLEPFYAKIVSLFDLVINTPMRCLLYIQSFKGNDCSQVFCIIALLKTLSV